MPHSLKRNKRLLPSPNIGEIRDTAVPEGGELSITAGGMTGGNGTCGKQKTTHTTVPEGGEQEKEGMRFAPFGDDGERAPADPQVT